jgi:hypothetical protein
MNIKKISRMVLLVSCFFLLISCSNKKDNNSEGNVVYQEKFDSIGNWNAFSGNKSSIKIELDNEDKIIGESSFRISFLVDDWAGIGLAFSGMQEWHKNDLLSFQIKGKGDSKYLRVELTDNGGERFSKIIQVQEDWVLVNVPLYEFKRREDWQPSDVPNDGLTLTSVEGISFSPIINGESVWYIDDLKIIRKK